MTRMEERLKQAFAKAKEPKIIGMDTRLGGKKWRGRAAHIVLRDDPAYLDWLKEQEGVQFTKELSDALDRSMSMNLSRSVARDAWNDIRTA